MNIRSFIAIKLSKIITDGLGNAIDDLKENGVQNVRWTSPQTIHITLKFLGDIDANTIEPISRSLQGVVRHYSPFEIDITGLGAFPKIDNPRILWIGIKAPDALSRMQKELESELNRFGFEKEERGFTPHLTLGRVTKNATRSDIRTIAEKIKSHKPIFIGSMSVDEIHLYRSNLLPEGPQHFILASFPLIG
jgi:2'-5' RNA ligase